MKKSIQKTSIYFITCIIIVIFFAVFMSEQNNQLMVHKLTLGPFQTNCYILVCKKTREAIIIDPGDDIEKVIKLIKEKELIVKKIILTHAHLDHCGHTSVLMQSLNELHSNDFEDTIYMHAKEKPLYQNLAEQGKMFQIKTSKPWTKVKYLDEKDTISFGKDHTLQILHTPGHSPGSLCFYSVRDSLVIAGDVLFQGSIGRTDLWQGNLNTLVESIKIKLLVMPDNTRVLPGHGPETMIKQEKVNNPFLSNSATF